MAMKARLLKPIPSHVLSLLCFLSLACTSPTTLEQFERMDALQKEQFITEQQTRIQNNKNDAVAYYQLALAYFEQQNLEQAELNIQRALSLSPIVGIYFELLGSIAYQNKKYSRAIDSLNTAIKLDRDLISAYLKLAMTYERIGDNERAIGALEVALQRSGPTLEIQAYLTRLNIKQRDFEVAENHLKNVLLFEPSNPEYRLLEVQIQMLQGNYYHAKVLVQQLLADEPTLAKAKEYLLKILFLQGNDKAILAQTQEPYSVLERQILARIAIKQKKWLLAQQTLQNLLEDVPLDAKSMVLLASVFLYQDQFEEAKIWLRRSVEIDEMQAEARYLLALVLFKEGNTLQGDNELARALELDFSNQRYQMLKIQRDMQTQNWNRVENALNEMQAESSLDPQLLHLQIDLYILRGQYELAEKLTLQLQELQDTPKVRFTLARLLYFQKRYQQAFAMTQNLSKQSSEDIAYLHASILNQMGRYDNTLTYLQPFLNAKKGAGLLHLQAGRALQYLKQDKEAQKIYEQGYQLFPEQVSLIDDLSLLYVKMGMLQEAEQLLVSFLQRRQSTLQHDIFLQRLSLIYAQTQRNDDALFHLKQLHSLNSASFQSDSYLQQEQTLLFAPQVIFFKSTLAESLPILP